MVHTPKFEAVPQLWEPISRSWTPAAPAQVIRLLTKGAVHAGNTRAVFVGVDAYQTAGGAVLCHLFEQDGGFSLQDAALLDRLVADRLAPQEAARRGWSPPAGAEPAAAEPAPGSLVSAAMGSSPLQAWPAAAYAAAALRGRPAFRPAGTGAGIAAGATTGTAAGATTGFRPRPIDLASVERVSA